MLKIEDMEVVPVPKEEMQAQQRPDPVLVEAFLSVIEMGKALDEVDAHIESLHRNTFPAPLTARHDPKHESDLDEFISEGAFLVLPRSHKTNNWQDRSANFDFRRYAIADVALWTLAEDLGEVEKSEPIIVISPFIWNMFYDSAVIQTIESLGECVFDYRDCAFEQVGEDDKRRYRYAHMDAFPDAFFDFTIAKRFRDSRNTGYSLLRVALNITRLSRDALFRLTDSADEIMDSFDVVDFCAGGSGFPAGGRGAGQWMGIHLDLLDIGEHAPSPRLAKSMKCVTDVLDILEMKYELLSQTCETSSMDAYDDALDTARRLLVSLDFDAEYKRLLSSADEEEERAGSRVNFGALHPFGRTRNDRSWAELQVDDLADETLDRTFRELVSRASKMTAMQRNTRPMARQEISIQDIMRSSATVHPDLRHLPKGTLPRKVVIASREFFHLIYFLGLLEKSDGTFVAISPELAELAPELMKEVEERADILLDMRTSDVLRLDPFSAYPSAFYNGALPQEDIDEYFLSRTRIGHGLIALLRSFPLLEPPELGASGDAIPAFQGKAFKKYFGKTAYEFANTIMRENFSYTINNFSVISNISEKNMSSSAQALIKEANVCKDILEHFLDVEEEEIEKIENEEGELEEKMEKIETLFDALVEQVMKALAAGVPLQDVLA